MMYEPIDGWSLVLDFLQLMLDHVTTVDNWQISLEM